MAISLTLIILTLILLSVIGAIIAALIVGVLIFYSFNWASSVLSPGKETTPRVVTLNILKTVLVISAMLLILWFSDSDTSMTSLLIAALVAYGSCVAGVLIYVQSKRSVSTEG
ncbi:MAG: hypothetical protein AB8G18_17240 [Gammaproteobacteria bacterium]